MSTIAKKTVSVPVLLCIAALGACALLAGPAMASETLTGAAAAPSEGTSTPPASTPPSSPQSSPSAQEGLALATWFGPGLFGRHTACGQLLTKQLVGVANRTLPCGTMVDFSYRGRQATVPVVDRGPYGSIGANWDLTYGAAHLLKLGGTAKIDAKVVGHVQNSPELGLPAGHSSSQKHRVSTVTGPSGGVEAS